MPFTVPPATTEWRFNVNDTLSPGVGASSAADTTAVAPTTAALIDEYDEHPRRAAQH